MHKAQSIFEGLEVIMITPFKSDYELNIPALKEHTRFLIDSGIRKGVGSLLVGGAGGEGPQMTTDESLKAVEAVMDEANGEVPAILGCYANDTATAIKMLKRAEDIGVEAAQISPTYHHKPSDEEVFQHYKRVNDSIDIGICIYNTPWSSGADLKPDIISRLVELENTVALKWSSYDWANYTKVYSLFSDKINMVDNMFPYGGTWFHVLGAKSTLTAIANWAPKYELNQWNLIKNKEYDQAHKEIMRFNLPYYHLVDDFTQEGVTGEGSHWKGGMFLVGKEELAGPPRPPHMPYNESQKKRLKELWDKSGVTG